jgi:hypothetical protein
MFLKLLQSPVSYAFALGLAALLVSVSGKGDNAPAPPRSNGSPLLVIVELFTSEGCSSCPPADALLKQLSEQQPLHGVQIIPLEEHVDYWNHLGWADPFSSSEFSQRQSDYAQVFGSDGVYTPQMIVDGQTEFVGSRGLSAREAIQKAADLPKLEVSLRVGANSKPDHVALEVQAQSPNGIQLRDALELWVAVTEKGLQSNVKAGENSGETLKHAPVVRTLRKVDSLRDPNGYRKQVELPLDPEWRKQNLDVVVFLAEKTTRRIVGVATASLIPGAPVH